MTTAVKICGITRVEDALAAALAGARAIGFVFYPPSPRAVTPERAAEIIRALPPFVTTVGLFVNAAPAAIDATLAVARVDLMQFHGEETPEGCRLCGVPYMKAVRVRPGVDLLQYAQKFGDAKALLLDAYVEGAHGGTGATFDWGLIPRTLSLPVVLSGGLAPENVADAIRRVRPWAVDVSSSVESEKGIKDAAKIAAFISGVRDADV
jgi:phosphoribosylanthranilate isomerase